MSAMNSLSSEFAVAATRPTASRFSSFGRCKRAKRALILIRDYRVLRILEADDVIQCT
jgi:hypothetical protein